MAFIWTPVSSGKIAITTHVNEAKDNVDTLADNLGVSQYSWTQIPVILEEEVGQPQIQELQDATDYIDSVNTCSSENAGYDGTVDIGVNSSENSAQDSSIDNLADTSVDSSQNTGVDASQNTGIDTDKDNTINASDNGTIDSNQHGTYYGTRNSVVDATRQFAVYSGYNTSYYFNQM